MKKYAILILLLFIMCIMAGCSSRIDYTLPQDPIEFNTGTFVNPNDAEDTYLLIEYNGRTYIYYGTIKGSIDENDVGGCLGYIVQDGKKLEDERIFPLTEDPNTDYLVRLFTEGVMNQPDFFRATDTVGQEIKIPRYIDPLDYDFWK